MSIHEVHMESDIGECCVFVIVAATILITASAYNSAQNVCRLLTHCMWKYKATTCANERMAMILRYFLVQRKTKINRIYANLNRLGTQPHQ